MRKTATLTQREYELTKGPFGSLRGNGMESRKGNEEKGKE